MNTLRRARAGGIISPVQHSSSEKGRLSLKDAKQSRSLFMKPRSEWRAASVLDIETSLDFGAVKPRGLRRLLLAVQWHITVLLTSVSIPISI